MISSFEDTQFGELSSTTCPPPPSIVPPTFPPDILNEPSPAATDIVGEEENQPLSGDIGDDVIDAIIASSDDDDG